jgi:hypothetical protein
MFNSHASVQELWNNHSGRDWIHFGHKALDYLDHFSGPFHLRIMTGTLDKH